MDEIAAPPLLVLETGTTSPDFRKCLAWRNHLIPSFDQSTVSGRIHIYLLNINFYQSIVLNDLDKGILSLPELYYIPILHYEFPSQSPLVVFIVLSMVIMLGL